MTSRSLQERAETLRDCGKFKEAYDAFLDAAEHTDNIVEKADLVLNATTNLTQLHEFDAAREQLDRVRQLLSVSVLPNKTGNPPDQQNVRRLAVCVEIEEAEILAAEKRLNSAVARLSRIVEEFGLNKGEPSLESLYDEVQSRKAYFLVYLDQWNKALPIFEELVSRKNDDPKFLFYLGYCYDRTGDLNRAMLALQRTLILRPPPHIDFQAHGTLGMVLYKMKRFAEAKQELEACASEAPPAYIKDADLWRGLELTCRALGLTTEADKYAVLMSTLI